MQTLSAAYPVHVELQGVGKIKFRLLLSQVKTACGFDAAETLSRLIEDFSDCVAQTAFEWQNQLEASGLTLPSSYLVNRPENVKINLQCLEVWFDAQSDKNGRILFISRSEFDDCILELEKEAWSIGRVCRRVEV